MSFSMECQPTKKSDQPKIIIDAGSPEELKQKYDAVMEVFASAAQAKPAAVKAKDANEKPASKPTAGTASTLESNTRGDKRKELEKMNEILLRKLSMLEVLIPEFNGKAAFDIVKEMGCEKTIVAMTANEMFELTGQINLKIAQYVGASNDPAATAWVELMGLLEGSYNLEELESNKARFTKWGDIQGVPQADGTFQGGNPRLFEFAKNYYASRKKVFEAAAAIDATQLAAVS